MCCTTCRFSDCPGCAVFVACDGCGCEIELTDRRLAVCERDTPVSCDDCAAARDAEDCPSCGEAHTPESDDVDLRDALAEALALQVRADYERDPLSGLDADPCGALPWESGWVPEGRAHAEAA